MKIFFWSSFDFKQLFYLQPEVKPLKIQGLKLPGREQQSAEGQFKFFLTRVSSESLVELRSRVDSEFFLLRI